MTLRARVSALYVTSLTLRLVLKSYTSVITPFSSGVYFLPFTVTSTVDATSLSKLILDPVSLSDA